jgi:hypothetical protein
MLSSDRKRGGVGAGSRFDGADRRHCPSRLLALDRAGLPALSECLGLG